MCPHFDGMKEKWAVAAEGAEDKVVVQYNLLGKMDSIREEHVKFISELARYNNEVRSRTSMFLCEVRQS